MDFFTIISTPFAWLLRVFNAWTGHYLLALLLFALLMKIILIPFGISQQKRQIKNAKLRPKIALIEKKYAGRNDQRTMQKKQQEIMDLQQKEGTSLTSGCLPLIIQLLLVILLYNIIQNPLTNICQFDGAKIDAIKAIVAENENLTQIAMMARIPENAAALMDGGVLTSAEISALPNFTLWGMDFANSPINVPGWMTVLPFLVFAVQFGTMKFSRIFMGDPTRKPGEKQPRNVVISNWIMDLMMPALSLYFAFTLPAALGVYWIYQGVLGLLQTIILAKTMPLPVITEEEIKEYERQMKGKKSSSDEPKPKVRSLHHIDDDDEDFPAPTPGRPVGKKSAIDKAPMKQEEKRPEPKEEPKTDAEEPEASTETEESAPETAENASEPIRIDVTENVTVSEVTMDAPAENAAEEAAAPAETPAPTENDAAEEKENNE